MSVPAKLAVTGNEYYEE